MKNLSRLLFVTILFVCCNMTNAQDARNPWAVSLGVNAVNVYPVGEDAPQGEYFDEFFNVKDHWNIMPSLTYIRASKYLTNGFSINFTGSINKITKWGQFGTRDGDVVAKVDNLNYYGLDAGINYSLQEVIKSNNIEPFVGVGGGYTWIEEGRYNTFSNSSGGSNNVGAGTVNGTLGVKYWFNDRLGVEAQTTYKHAFEDYLTSHFQNSVGVTFKFGGTDTDGDGIYDQDDACPETPGLEAFNGCPDADGDGIQDSKDDCPNEAGLAEFNGCPDSDGDGVVDNKDNCPTVAGVKSLMGCPDADGDGVADANDGCPEVAGPTANKGCPWPDTDGDGIYDKDDNCPKVAGVVANKGCPEVVAPPVEVINELNRYAKTILFDTGKSSFKQETYSVLQAMTAILKKYPKANFTIEGHTDSVGSKTTNQRLSDKRANAVRDYLVQNGIGSARLTAKGYGEDSPISSNRTKSGRKENRRVEVKLVN